MQLALKDQELLVTIVAMAPRRHAGGHAIDVKPGAQGLILIQLQNGIAQGHAVRVDEGRESCIVDIGNATVGSSNRFHLWAFLFVADYRLAARSQARACWPQRRCAMDWQGMRWLTPPARRDFRLETAVRAFSGNPAGLVSVSAACGLMPPILTELL